MFSLQLTVLNLHSIRNQDLFITGRINMKFGNLQTDIDIVNGFGGKRILFEMEIEEVKNLLYYYAFGLFMKLYNQEQSGKYFCLLSLEKINVNDSLEQFKINFKDEQRNNRFQGQIQLIIKEQPNAFAKIRPKSAKAIENDYISSNMERQNLGLKQFPSYQNQTVNSFLYGTSIPAKNPQMNKTFNPKGNGGNPNPYGSSSQQLKKIKNKQIAQKNPPKKIQKNIQLQESEDQYNPPMMQFTNDVSESKKEQIYQSKIPAFVELDQNQLQNNQYQKMNERNKFQKVPSKTTNTQIKPQNLVKKRKQELRQLANQFYETNMKKNKNQVMIPILEGNTYKLVSLQGLSNEEIIEYVKKSKENQKSIQTKKKIQQNTKQKQYPLPPQKLGNNEKKKYPAARPSSALNSSQRRDHNIRNSIQQELSSNQNYQQDYQSDFQSLSIANSAIKSRARSNSIAKKPGNQLQESIGEYSQDFQSYSQSVISKSQTKRYPHTYSQISQSIRSLQQSYKK